MVIVRSTKSFIQKTKIICFFQEIEVSGPGEKYGWIYAKARKDLKYEGCQIHKPKNIIPSTNFAGSLKQTAETKEVEVLIVYWKLLGVRRCKSNKNRRFLFNDWDLESNLSTGNAEYEYVFMQE